MKANELMINDWVKSLKEDHSGEYGQVIDIDHHDTVLLEYQCVNYYTDVEHIEPIPITPEILEKNFRRDKTWTGAYYINDGVHIYYDQDIDCWTVQYMEIADLRYVHELQHALKLCGIEKEIEL